MSTYLDQNPDGHEADTYLYPSAVHAGGTIDKVGGGDVSFAAGGAEQKRNVRGSGARRNLPATRRRLITLTGGAAVALDAGGIKARSITRAGGAHADLAAGGSKSNDRAGQRRRALEDELVLVGAI